MDDAGLAALIRETRQAAGVSQRALAVRAGTSQAWVSRVEAGRVAPSFDAASRLLLALGHTLAPTTQPLEGHDLDTPHRAAWRALSSAQRLDRALAWMRLGGELHGAARR